MLLLQAVQGTGCTSPANSQPGRPGQATHPTAMHDDDWGGLGRLSFHPEELPLLAPEGVSANTAPSTALRGEGGDGHPLTTSEPFGEPDLGSPSPPCCCSLTALIAPVQSSGGLVRSASAGMFSVTSDIPGCIPGSAWSRGVPSSPPAPLALHTQMLTLLTQGTSTWKSSDEKTVNVTSPAEA